MYCPQIDERRREAQRKEELAVRQKQAKQHHKAWVRTKVEEERKQREMERRRREAEKVERQRVGGQLLPTTVLLVKQGTVSDLLPHGGSREQERLCSLQKQPRENTGSSIIFVVRRVRRPPRCHYHLFLHATCLLNITSSRFFPPL